MPGGVWSSFCNLDLFLFPYDVQKCDLIFEIWRYSTLKQYFDDIEAQQSFDFFANEEWDLLNLSKKIKIWETSSGNFQQAVFTILIKIKSEYFALTVILPCLLIGTIELVHLFCHSMKQLDWNCPSPAFLPIQCFK